MVLAKSLSKDLAQRRPCTGTHNITESGGGKHHHTSHCCHIWLNSQNLLLTIKVDGSVMDSINAGGGERKFGGGVGKYDDDGSIAT